MLRCVCYFRHASRYASPEPNRDEDRLAQQNENLVHYIESWMTLAKQLIKQQEQLMNNQAVMDDEKISSDSLISSDKELANDSLLCQLQVSSATREKKRCCSSRVCSRNVNKKSLACKVCSKKTVVR